MNTHNTTIWLTKKFLRRFEKKVCKFLKSKYASSLSQFYMALVVFCMKFFTLNVSKKLSIHFSSTFYIFKTFSGTRAIQRTLNRVFAMRQTQANVDKSVKNVKFCSYVAYLIAYGAIWKFKRFGLLKMKNFKKILWNLGRFLEILKKPKKKNGCFQKKTIRTNEWILFMDLFFNGLIFH